MGNGASADAASSASNVPDTTLSSPPQSARSTTVKRNKQFQEVELKPTPGSGSGDKPQSRGQHSRSGDKPQSKGQQQQTTSSRNQTQQNPRKGDDVGASGTTGRQSQTNRKEEDIVFETFYHRSGKEFQCIYQSGMRFYLDDWGSKEWQPFPKRWYNEGLLVTNSIVKDDADSRNNGSGASGSGANGQGSQGGQRRSRGQDDREGYIMHPTRGKLPTYIFYKRHNVHMYMDKDTGSWMRLPIGWELNQPLVKELVNQVEEAIPHWNDRHDILAMLRSCNYDPNECINTYIHLEGDEWLKVPKTAKDAKAFVAKDVKIAELEMKVRNLEIEVQKCKTDKEEAEALASPALPSTSSCAEELMLSGTESHNLGSSLKTTIPSSLSTISSEDSGMDNIAEPVKSAEKQIPEEKIQKDEKVFELQHIKHDFIEKDHSFTVLIYVKEIKKDAVRVNFEPQTLIVRFQTGDKRFLQLHKMNEDVVFLWKIQLRGEIIPEKSKHKITSSLIDITLGKKEFTRWGDLEALKIKSPPESLSQSDTWININQVKPAALPSSRNSPDDENQARKERDIKREKSEINKGKENKINQNEASKENVAQTPTCKVSPLKKNALATEILVSPGMTGLDNLGNTCFMNSVLQCLANTREFRDIFLDSSFKSDLNTSNSLGTGGKLAMSFAILMKVLWSGHHYSYAPSKLKSLVALKARQFTGFAKHDAQQFMAFLLDGLHEDLNRVQKKPYTQTVEDRGRPDDVVASEAWEVYKKRNDSFIVDMFQGQYKSKLVCPECGKVSITFDPFLYLSLPLPKKQRLLPVTFFSKDLTYKKPVKYMLKLAKDSTVENLKELLYRKTGVHPTNIRVFEAFKGKFQKIFHRGSDLGSVQTNDVIIACEVLSKDLAGEEVYEISVIQRTVIPNQLPTRCCYCKRQCPPDEKLKRCTKCLKVGYCNQQCQKNHWQTHRPFCKLSPDPVGCPFIISIPQSRATFSRISKLMEAYARYSVDVFQPPVINDNMPSMSSQLSTSNLSSSSSQSSGSLSSLDSQSSYSSTCTITAEDREQILEDIEDLEKLSDTSLIPQVWSEQDLSLSSQTGSFSSPESSVNSLGPSSVEMELSIAADEVDKNTQCEASKSNNATATEMDLSRDQDKNLTASSIEPRQSNVNPVLGIQTGETGHNSPPFFLKPVDQDGIGLSGPDGERLEDEGDAALDLSGLRFLSMDWKNNEKHPGYVLVQTKELEVENDESMVTASLDEVNTAYLSQCLELFTEPEVLSQEEAWYCPQCKEHREATKQMSIWKLPHTLIVQLKRFSFRNFILRDKIDKMVEFPVRDLDLSPYYVGARPANEPPPIYDLYAVVNHHGGILGGHYTAYVRCADVNDHKKNLVGWRLCDDSRVSNISHEKNVVTRAAYLLFYRRREPFILPERSIPSPESDNKEEEEEAVTKEKELNGKDETIPQLGSLNKMYVEVAKHDELPEIGQMSDDKFAPPFSDNIEDNDLAVDSVSGSYTDMDSVD